MRARNEDFLPELGGAATPHMSRAEGPAWAGENRSLGARFMHTIVTICRLQHIENKSNKAAVKVA
jgi:hypothetical protein